jgi:hypothetical protein
MNTNKPNQQRKRRPRRRGNLYYELFYHLAGMKARETNDGRNLSQQCFHAAFWLRNVSKAQCKPEVSLAAATVVYCWQKGLLSQEAWDNMQDTLYLNSSEWYAATDALFVKAMGRHPNRTSRITLKDEGLDMWDRVTQTLPYTPDQMQWLVKAFEYEQTNHKNFSYADRQRYYYQPPKFEEEEKPKIENEPEEKPSEDTSSFLAALLLAYLGGRGGDDERYGGRYGYLPGTRPHMSKLLEEEGNPEQEAHANQDCIDAVAASLLADVNI